jgi:hypothetical protein
MAVNNIRPEVAHYSPSSNNSAYQCEWQPRHFQPLDAQPCRPFASFARPHHDHNDLVPARRHPFSYRNGLPFRPADAKRRKHVGYPHKLSPFRKDGRTRIACPP